jgi:hypothetical protein
LPPFQTGLARIVTTNATLTETAILILDILDTLLSNLAPV